MEFEIYIPEKVMEIRKICFGHEKVMEIQILPKIVFS